jgi:GNAT superfamily N-acetyltransferase
VIAIRLLKSEEFDALCTLLDGYKRDIEEEALTADARQRLSEAVESGKIRFFVACEGEQLVGMCSLCETFSTYRCRRSGIFEDFYIVPSRRRTGLARRMTRAVFEYAAQNGIDTLWVGSSPSDVKMYDSLGFDVPLGSLRCWSAGEA